MNPADVATFVEAAGDVNGLFDNLQRHSIAGQFSAVFRARHVPTGKTVALKFLADRGDPQRHDAFAREGILLNTSLREDPHCFVPLVAPPGHLQQTATLPNGQQISFSVPYLALEWLPRGTPEIFVQAARGHADLLHRLALIKSMLRVLCRAHFRDVAHRDVKPSNFLLTSRNAVKLNDFGSAMTVSATTATYVAAPRGDLRYTAPELLIDVAWPANVIFGSDIYSLGCTAFELITGQELVAHGLFGKTAQLITFRNILLQLPPALRKDSYEKFMGAEDPRLPDLRTINPDLPRCVYPPLTELLRAICHFDYRYRERSGARIHRLLQICVLVVSNEFKAMARARLRRSRQPVTP